MAAKRQKVAELNAGLGADGVVFVDESPGLGAKCVLTCGGAKVELWTFGAHITSWQADGKPPQAPRHRFVLDTRVIKSIDQLLVKLQALSAPGCRGCQSWTAPPRSEAASRWPGNYAE